ncbi:VWA domain-containing protein [Pseudomonadota bacterium]
MGGNIDEHEWILSGWFMMNRLVSILIVWWLMLPNVFAQTDIATTDSKLSDVRVLIDISGSMKKNDPNNLRIPALKLITQLMPNGTRSGVWTFGQYVNMLVERGEVDEAWKKKAYDVANKVNSKGKFTNIEGVLKDATWDWIKPDESQNRSIIFLTDGVVDVSKDVNANKEARTRILDKVLTRLKDSGIAIHTIALSDEADKPFLRQLSAATGGAYEQVETAAQLERVFLKMFEKTVPVSSIPMTNNSVLVDNSINELTLLIFRKEGAQEASISLPNGDVLSHRKHPDGVNWRHEERYDMVTVQKPMAGSWQVNAELDPDNRVMVVTDLNVRASRLPNIMMSGDQVPYYVELHEKNSVITKPEFLDFVTITLTRKQNDAQQHKDVLSDNGSGIDKRAEDGRFSSVIGGKNVGGGHYDYEMLVNGTTFKRSKRYTVHVVDAPVAVNVTEVKAGNPAHYALTITPYAELIKANTLIIDASITKEGGSAKSITIPRAGPNEWRLDMDVKTGDSYHVDISVLAERLNGKPVTRDVGRYTMGIGSVDDYQGPGEIALPAIVLPEKAPIEEPEHEKEPENAEPPSHSEEPVVEPAKHEEEAPASAEHATEDEAATGEEGEEAESSANWMLVVAKVIGLNLLLILGGYFAYRKWFSSPSDDSDEDLGEGVEDEGKDK